MWKRREGRVRKAMRMLNAWIDDRGPLPWAVPPSPTLHPTHAAIIPVSAAAAAASSSSTAFTPLKRLSKKELEEVRQQDKSLGRLLGLTRGKETLFLAGKHHSNNTNGGAWVRRKDGTTSTGQSVYERTDTLHTEEEYTGTGTGLEASSLNEHTTYGDIHGDGTKGADEDTDLASQLAIWGVRAVSHLMLCITICM